MPLLHSASRGCIVRSKIASGVGPYVRDLGTKRLGTGPGCEEQRRGLTEGVPLKPETQPTPGYDKYPGGPTRY